MRLSLMKAAHADMGGAACRKSGSPFFPVPRTLVRTWGTRLVADKTGFYAASFLFLGRGQGSRYPNLNLPLSCLRQTLSLLHS
jgi:hypothetical protein